MSEVDAELAAIEALRRPSGRACPVELFFAVATDVERQAYEKAIARGLFGETAAHFRTKYPNITLHDKAVRGHARRECRCFR